MFARPMMSNNNNNKHQHISCTNCNKIGHVHANCNVPVISTGIITVRLNESGLREYLMVRRKDSFGYSDFLRGKYNVYNKIHVANLIDEMTINEKQRLHSNTFETLWSDLWGNNNSNRFFRNDDYIAKVKFHMITSGVIINRTEKYSLDSLLEENKSNWTESEWGFPKGRRNVRESDLDCAKREWEEETGYSIKNVSIIQNLVPYEEIFTGSNYKSYIHKYFIAIYNGEVLCEQGLDFHRNEISQVKWMTFDECVANIRSYNYEKLKILNKIETIFHKYEIVA